MRPTADIVSISTERGIESINTSEENAFINGIHQQSGAKTGVSTVTHVEHAQQNLSSIPLVNRVLWESEKKVKVITIGCGFSGLTLAQKIQHKYKLDHKIEHVIYEKNSEIGGTWFEVSLFCWFKYHLT